MQIKEFKDKRVVEIGEAPGHKIETFYSRELLELILSIKGPNFLKDEIDRAENPGYVKNNLLNLIYRFTSLNGKKVLDFGSGSGASSVILAREGTSVIGIEPNNDLIKIAKLRARDSGVGNKVEFIESMQKLPFGDRTFDIIIFNAVIEHIHPKERRATIKEIWRVLRPGGYLFITETPNRLWPIDSHTTGLLFVPYLPLPLARRYAILFSKRVDSSKTVDDLIKSGIRGSTYWEVINSLKGEGVTELNKGKYDVDEYFKSIGTTKQSFAMKIAKSILKYFYKALDFFVCRPLKIPISGFLPELRICLKKR